jgi:spore photoproduct lyase
MNPDITHLIIERAAQDDPLARRVRERLPEAGVSVTDDPWALLGRRPLRETDLAAAGERESPPRTGPGGKSTLLLMRHKGSFVKDFPPSPGSPPCGERYIVSMLNCPYRCTYCYLQSYLDHDRLVLYTDLERMKEEIGRSISSGAPIRITTGEMSDSLALDGLTGTTLELLPLFEGTGTSLEVRTKSAAIDHLLPALEARAASLVLTWTLGPIAMIRREEPGTAPLPKRLEAMRRAVRAGIRVGVRLDPIVPHYADMESYGSLVEEIAEAVKGERIERFEIGALRFPPGLMEKVRDRDPGSMLLRGEYLKDPEGKLRLYRPARVALYRGIARLVRDAFPRIPIELSMESRDIWEDAGIDLPAR